MNIKELKSALDAAKSEFEADKNNADLKSAYYTALESYQAGLDADSEEEEGDEEGDKKKSASGKQDDEEDDDSLNESGLDEKTKTHLKKLRRENAKWRTQNKNLNDRLGKLESGLKGLFGGDDNTEITADNINSLKGNNEALAFKTAVLEAAIEYGVGKDEREYFEFLVGRQISNLAEGEELAEDDLVEIAKKAKKKSAGGNARTSVDDSGAGNPDKKGNATLDQFVNMSITEKSDLFVKNRALYDQLFAQAKEKRRL